MKRGARRKLLATRCSVGVLTAITATTVGGCNISTLSTHNSSDWFLKSVKTDAHGDVVTLYHAGKLYVARCAGNLQPATNSFLIPTVLI